MCSVGLRENNATCLEIFALGDFMVKCGDTLLSEQAKRSNKLWELFKFFLTNKGKRIPSETIVETLWPEQENANPRTALYDLTYRLRRLFENESLSGEKALHIEYSQGCYCFNLGKNCCFDVDDFVMYSERAHQLKASDPALAKEMYRKSIGLYKGTYLSASVHKEWLLAARYYYRRIYLNNVLQLVQLLKEENNHNEIKHVCENAFLIDTFLEEERIHLQYIEALAEEGETGNALTHYEFITSVLYNETGVRPSPAMRDLYQRQTRNQSKPILCPFLAGLRNSSRCRKPLCVTVIFSGCFTAWICAAVKEPAVLTRWGC